MYQPDEYSAMLADDVRVRAYLAAIRATVRPGDVVLDAGAGPGFFAVAACKAGAVHVFAIEPDDIISLGPAIAAENGCGDRITFIRAPSGRVTLPTRATVLVEDMRGVLPVHAGRMEVLADVAKRLLTADARRIPRTDTMWASPCRAPRRFQNDKVYTAGAVSGIALTPLQTVVRSGWLKARMQAHELLAAPQQWCTLDYASRSSVSVDGSVSYQIDRTATMDGWCVWFDADLAEGVAFSNAPGEPEAIYSQAFFPLDRSLQLAPGDSLTGRFRIRSGGPTYVWAWDTTLARAGGERLELRQSDLPFLLLDPARVREGAPDAPPPMTPPVQLYATMLGLVDGVRSNTAIANALCAAHPDAFRSHAEAFRFVVTRLDGIRRDTDLA